jgi:hypothetical protein
LQADHCSSQANNYHGIIHKEMNFLTRFHEQDRLRVAKNTRGLQELSGLISVLPAENRIESELAQHCYRFPFQHMNNSSSPPSRDLINPLDLLGHAVNISGDDVKPASQSNSRKRPVAEAESNRLAKDFLHPPSDVATQKTSAAFMESHTRILPGCNEICQP